MGAANAGKKQRGKPFEPGQSGNPAGKRKGTRNKNTLAALELLDGEAETLTRKAIEKAKEGDMAALRLCLDRIVPPARDRPFSLTLPEFNGVSDLPKVTAAILAAASAGKIGPTEAATLGKLVEQHARAAELAELESRLKALEEKLSDKGGSR